MLSPLSNFFFASCSRSLTCCILYIATPPRISPAVVPNNIVVLKKCPGIKMCHFRAALPALSGACQRESSSPTASVSCCWYLLHRQTQNITRPHNRKPATAARGHGGYMSRSSCASAYYTSYFFLSNIFLSELEIQVVGVHAVCACYLVRTWCAPHVARVWKQGRREQQQLNVFLFQYSIS